MAHNDISKPNLFSAARRGGKKVASDDSNDSVTADERTPFEHDFDRLLFSSPIRRLADKTQVFPLEQHDSVRTRLTHSHEVSNLARSIGNRLVRTKPNIFGDDAADKATPTILAAVGLAHDLGNPPFGHQGENAIRSWFAGNEKLFRPEGTEEVPTDLQYDFLEFEGNAQTIRLVTRLKVTVGGI